MKAIIMAGGRASRFGKNTEKALIELQGKTLLDRSLETLGNSSISEIIVSVSSNTPKTIDYCKKNGIATILTSGTDYHKDLYDLLSLFGNFISLNVDCPFIGAKDVKKLIRSIDKISIACVVSRELVKFSIDEQSITKDANGRQFVWVGLNYVTFSKESELLESGNHLLALNINSPDDLILAKKYLDETTG